MIRSYGQIYRYKFGFLNMSTLHRSLDNRDFFTYFVHCLIVILTSVLFSCNSVTPIDLKSLHDMLPSKFGLITYSIDITLSKLFFNFGKIITMDFINDSNIGKLFGL